MNESSKIWNVAKVVLKIFIWTLLARVRLVISLDGKLVFTRKCGVWNA